MDRHRLVQRVRRGMAADGDLQGLTTGVKTPSAEPSPAGLPDNGLVIDSDFRRVQHHEEEGECRGVEAQLVRPAMGADRYPRSCTRRAHVLHGEGKRCRAGWGARAGHAEHGRGGEV